MLGVKRRGVLLFCYFRLFVVFQGCGAGLRLRGIAWGSSASSFCGLGSVVYIGSVVQTWDLSVGLRDKRLKSWFSSCRACWGGSSPERNGSNFRVSGLTSCCEFRKASLSPRSLLLGFSDNLVFWDLGLKSQ